MSVCKIAVIDDERPARKELILQIQAILPDSEIEEAESGSGGMELLSRGFFDLIFIDMQLNDMEGTTLAIAARKLYPEAKIVFATAYSQYAVRAFEIGADDYILKPFDPERIKAVIEKFQKDWENAQEDTRPVLDGKLAINVNRSIFLLDIRKLVYLETSGRGCILHTTSGDYEEKQFLGKYEKRLSGYGFFRIHKSYLVNLEYITKIFPWANNSLAVAMRGFEEETLPVGRERLKDFKEKVGI